MRISVMPGVTMAPSRTARSVTTPARGRGQRVANLRRVVALGAFHHAVGNRQQAQALPRGRDERRRRRVPAATRGIRPAHPPIPARRSTRPARRRQRDRSWRAHTASRCSRPSATGRRRWRARSPRRSRSTSMREASDNLARDRRANPEAAGHGGRDGDACAGRFVGIDRNQFHVHEWRLAGLVEFLPGHHRVMPVQHFASRTALRPCVPRP